MTTFIYDFKEGKSVDPLQGVTHFYVNPYQLADTWRALDLGNKVEGTDVELVIQGSTGLPVIIIPISLLNLGKCVIKMNDDLSGKIINGNKTIYFSTIVNSLLRINTVTIN